MNHPFLSHSPPSGLSKALNNVSPVSRSKDIKSAKVGLAAAALQDHFINSFRSSQAVSHTANSISKSANRPQSHRARQLSKWKAQSQQSQSRIKFVLGTSEANKVVSRFLNGEHEDQEYVLDSSKCTSLAERLGLFKMAAQLTAQEWTVLKRKISERCVHSHPCPICQEDFKLERQVLTSCGHTYHLQCIQSYERYSSRQSCPMCRSTPYEKRVIFDAKREFKLRCVIKIQARIRCFLARKAFCKYLDDHPPKEPLLRKRLFAQKISKLTTQLVHERQQDTGTLDTFLAGLDLTLQRSRDLHVVEPSEELEIRDQDWKDVLAVAVKRGINECPICMQDLSLQDVRRKVALLSCSHVFHSRCIDGWEKFSKKDSEGLSSHAKCPVCRKDFGKTIL